MRCSNHFMVQAYRLSNHLYYIILHYSATIVVQGLLKNSMICNLLSTRKTIMIRHYVRQKCIIIQQFPDRRTYKKKRDFFLFVQSIKWVSVDMLSKYYRKYHNRS